MIGHGPLQKRVGRTVPVFGAAGIGSQISTRIALQNTVHHDSSSSGQGAVADGDAGSGGWEVCPEVLLVVSIDFGKVGYFGEVEVYVDYVLGCD